MNTPDIKLKDAVFTVIEGFNIPPDVRKILETAYYAAPSVAHQWIGLTDDEIMDMYNEPRSDAEMIAFGRELEAKLKDKNYISK